MRQRKERGVRRDEHPKATVPAAPNWENARIFLVVARSKSIRAAATHLSLSANTLRAQISQLERQLGATLFTRHVDGVRLTEEGHRVLAIAQRMELDAFDLVRAAGRTAEIAGEVRLSATEGLGIFWIAPRIVEFQRANPDVLIDLRCHRSTADILRLEADVAVQLTRPVQKEVRVVKLGRMHMLPFASRSYVERYGLPKRAEDIGSHLLVAQIGEQLVTPEQYGRELGQLPNMHYAMRSNVSGAQYWSIATGVGIGLLPTYTMAVGAQLIPVDVGFHPYQDIWLVYHPDASRIRRVRNFIDWLIELFSPQRYPWFADEFLHPRDFPKDRGDLPQPELATFFLPERERSKRKQ